MDVVRALQLLFLFWIGCCEGFSIKTTSPRDVVSAFMDESPQLPPLQGTILCVPSSCCKADLIYEQRSTRMRVDGLEKIEKLCRRFDEDFQSDSGVSSSIERISLVEDGLVLVQWNVTWIPPTTAWLEALGNIWPGVRVQPTTYNHLSNQVSTFSWKAVYRLFGDAIKHGSLRVPLACIEGQSRLQFVRNDNDSSKWMLEKIVEDLSYAQDLSRQTLLNRRCADDLRVFLETGRRIDTEENWDDIVATRLNWASVPGSNPLDLDPNEEGPEAAIVAFGLASVIMVAFASFLGPLVLGQSMFGPPTYIVPPSELNDII